LLPTPKVDEFVPQTRHVNLRTLNPKISPLKFTPAHYTANRRAGIRSADIRGGCGDQLAGLNLKFPTVNNEQ
jgi:hypothetical protein